jgi:hypothetical protein
VITRSGESASRSVPQADPVLARDCDVCRGWGTVITTQGHHEVCPQCQTGTETERSAASTPTDCLAEWWHFLTQRTAPGL